MRTNRKLAALFGSALAFTAAQAGRLEPPDPVRETRTAAEETQPCTPIDASDIPLTISASGSYCLIEDISGVTSTAITIDAQDVTLDLNGYTISGNASGSSDYSIGVWSTRAGTVVRDGRVSGFDYGVALDADARVVDVQVNGATFNGITLPGNGEVLRCGSSDNGQHGIFTESGTVIRESAARDNSLDGIYASGTILVDGFVAEGNTGKGIWVGSGSTVRRSIASGNGSDGIHLQGIGPDYDVAAGGIVEDCSVDGNGGDGIYVGSFTLVVNNQVHSNSQNGIHTTSGGNRVDGNHLTFNDYGLVTDVGGNTIIRNSARQNVSGNYSFVAGNDVGPLGTALQSNSPWTNFDY